MGRLITDAPSRPAPDLLPGFQDLTKHLKASFWLDPDRKSPKLSALLVMKNLLLLLSLGALLVGCTTVKSYVANTEPGPPRAADYPIYIYNEKMSVPRPYEIIGTLSIRDTPFTVFGGSFEGELDTLRKHARRKGADAVQLTSVEQPDFLHSKYRVTANLVRFTNAWESLPLSETDFRAYLTAKAGTLDPVEGFWVSNDAMRSRVGIVRDNTRSGRDFFAFMLTTGNPTWKPGDRKLELARGERAGVYRGVYYFDDYRRKIVAFSLLGAQTNLFVIPMASEEPPIIFMKE